MFTNGERSVKKLTTENWPLLIVERFHSILTYIRDTKSFFFV